MGPLQSFFNIYLHLNKKYSTIYSIQRKVPKKRDYEIISKIAHKPR